MSRPTIFDAPSVPLKLYPLLLLLIACGAEVPPADPQEYIVVGNDLGSRNEFIDMGNVVVLTDSLLTVHSLLYEEHVGQYPVSDSAVWRTENDGWRLEPGEDSLLYLVDSLKGNRYHLKPLLLPDLSADLHDYLRGEEFMMQGVYRYECYLLFAGEERGLTKKCYASRCYSTQERDSVRYVHPQQDGYWFINDRFRQPVIVQSVGRNEHRYLLVDSLQEKELFVTRLSDNIPSGRYFQSQLAPLPASQPPVVAELVDRLDFAAATATPLFVPNPGKRWQSSVEEYDYERGNGMNVIEMEHTKLVLTGNTYTLTAGGRTIRTGSYQQHEARPYLILDEGCDNADYLPISLNNAEQLVITIPAVVTFPRTRKNFRPDPVTGALVEFEEEVAAYTANEITLGIPIKSPASPGK